MKMTTRVISGVALSGAIAMAFGSIDRAQAATIVLGNTGTGTYSITSAPQGASTTVATVPNGAFPIPPWFANTATSSWIAPNTFQADSPVGNYTYSTTFDLTGLVASTAQISGNWAGDNTGVSILLNGLATGITANAGSVNFGSFTRFRIESTANFLAGVNTLAFTINNLDEGLGNTPTGFRAELAGTADSTAIPEPSDIVGTAIAFGSVVLLKRNLSKKKSISQ